MDSDKDAYIPEDGGTTSWNHPVQLNSDQDAYKTEKSETDPNCLHLQQTQPVLHTPVDPHELKKKKKAIKQTMTRQEKFSLQPKLKK